MTKLKKGAIYPRSKDTDTLECVTVIENQIPDMMISGICFVIPGCLSFQFRPEVAAHPVVYVESHGERCGIRFCAVGELV